jgi:hypothetical protein
MTRREMLALLSDESVVDRFCAACDWLEEVTGEPVPEAEYSQDSIVEAVEAEDVSLLRRVGG